MVEMILYPDGIKNEIEYNKALKTFDALAEGDNVFENYYLSYLVERINKYEDKTCDALTNNNRK